MRNILVDVAAENNLIRMAARLRASERLDDRIRPLPGGHLAYDELSMIAR